MHADDAAQASIPAGSDGVNFPRCVTHPAMESRWLTAIGGAGARFGRTTDSVYSLTGTQLGAKEGADSN